MESPDDDLWEQVYATFEAHRLRTDPDAQAALNRIAAKCLGLSEVRSFDPSNCRVRRELLRQEALRTLKRYHQRKEPLRDYEPIVVIEWRGRSWVVDGNTRVNKWIADGAPQPRSAIIITPETDGCLTTRCTGEGE